MLRRSKVMLGLTLAVVLFIAGMALWVRPGFAGVSGATVHKVTVPEEDRFTKFAITIHRGDTVKWVNKDTDNHTVVSDDVFNSAGHDGTDHLLPGTDNNNGKPGKFKLTFTQAGTFVYYCRFHSQLDASNQPIAPGPFGGIPGTPMMGVITVLP